jgi:hypothetical protein
MVSAAARRRLRLYAAAFLRRVVDEISAAPYETDDEAPGTPSYSRGSDDDTRASRADDDAWVVPCAEDFETEDDDLKFSHAGLVLQVSVSISLSLQMSCPCFSAAATPSRSANNSALSICLSILPTSMHIRILSTLASDEG